MGFYGNIRNTTNNSFKFDFIYSNRTVMEQNANTDGIFGGRFVLVEYDQAMSEIPIKDGGISYKIYQIDNKFYTSYKLTAKETQTYERNEAGEVINVIREVEGYYLTYSPAQGFSTAKAAVESLAGSSELANDKVIGIYTAGIRVWNEDRSGWVLDTAKDEENFVSKEDKWYDSIQYEDSESGIASRPILGEDILYYGITKDNEIKNIENDKDDAYTVNYTIDKYNYGNGRGYDSTVWRKVYDEDGIGRYVMLAELNSVVPTFTVLGNPPQLTDDGYPGATPFTPYFDKDSTNVFYKLHITTPWDFRVASFTDWEEYDSSKTLPDNESLINITENKIIKSVPADAEKRQRDIVSYQKDNNQWTTIHTTETYDSALYFNKAGFTDLDYSRNVDPKSITSIGDTILVRPIGKSGRKYTSIDPETGMSRVQEEIDTQELAIILPTIGNIVSEVYDKLYGPGILKENAKIVYDDNGVEQHWPDGSIKYEYDVVEDRPRQRGIHWEDPVDLHIDDGRHRMVSDKNNGYYYTPLKDNPDGSTTAPQRVDSLAGAINSVHDLLGMIVTRHLPAQKTAQDLGFAVIPDTSEIYLPNAYQYYIYCEPLYELVYVRETVDGTTHTYPEGELKLNYIPTSDFIRVEGKNYYKKNGNNYTLYTGSISDGKEYYELENLYCLSDGYMVLATDAKGYNGQNDTTVFAPEVKYYRETGNNNFFYAAKTYGYKELDMSDSNVKNKFIPDGNGAYGYQQHRPVTNVDADNNPIIKKYSSDKYRQIGDTPYWIYDDGDKAFAETLYYDLPATLEWAGRLSGGNEDIYTKSTNAGVTTYTLADKENMEDGVPYYTLSNNYKIRKGSLKTYNSTGGITGSVEKLKEYYVPQWLEHYFVYSPAKGYTFWKDSVANFSNMSLEQQRNRWIADANAGKIYHNFSEATFGWGGTPVPSSDGGERMEYNFYIYAGGVHFIQRFNKLSDKIEYVSLTGQKTYKDFSCMQEFKDYIDATCVSNSSYEYDTENLWRKDGEEIIFDDDAQIDPETGLPVDSSDIRVITHYSQCPIYKFIFEDPDYPFFTYTTAGNYNQITSWKTRYIGDGGSSMDKNDTTTWPNLDAYFRLTENLVTPYKKDTYYVIESYNKDAAGVTPWDNIVSGLNDGTVTRIRTTPGSGMPYCKVLEFKLSTADNVQLDKIYWRCNAPTLVGVGISPKIVADEFQPYLGQNKNLYFVDNVLEWSPEEGRFEMANRGNEIFANKYNTEDNIQYYIEEKLSIIDPGSFSDRFSLYQLWNFNLVQNEDDYNYFFNSAAHQDDPDWKPVRLGYKIDTYVKRDLQGFARDINTMHGLLLRVNEILQTGDYRTRDENTIQGCINILHDLFEKFDNLVPGHLLGVNQYGEIESKKLADVMLFSKDASPIGVLESPKGDVPITTEETLRSGIEKLIAHINAGASNITLNEYNNYYDESPYYVTPDSEKQPGKTYYIKQGNTFVQYNVDPWPEENRPVIYEKYVIDQKGNIPDVDNNDNINEAIAKLQWQLNHIANRLLTDLDSNANQVPNNYNAFTNDTVTNGIAATDTLGIGLNKLQKQLEDLNSRLYHFSDRKLIGIGNVSTSSTAPLTDTDTLGQGLTKLQNRIYNIENFQITGANNESGLTNIFAGIIRTDGDIPTTNPNAGTGYKKVPALRSGWIWVNTSTNYIYIKTRDGCKSINDGKYDYTQGEYSTFEDGYDQNFWELLNAWQ